MLTRRRLLALSATSVFAPAVLSRSAHAQAASRWPERPVHMIVPIAAGGPTDSNARLVAQQLTKFWGQQVIIDNKGGAGTNIGNEFVAHADPDGYTILYGTSSLASNGALYRALSYSPTKDLAPVSMVSKFPFFMFVPNSSPAKTVKEFVDDARSKPGKLIMGSPGTGSGPHLAEVLFMNMARIQMTHAPYRGAAPAFIDLIPGRIDCYFGSGELLTYSRSGQVRVLGSTGTKRSPSAPEVPTIAEAGVPGYEVESWQAIFAPAKTPPAIIEKMHAGMVKAAAEPSLIKKLALGAYSSEASTPRELEAFLAADTAKWSAIIKSAGLKIN
jgi:tripartite-type tricarboxylate transporter receptor subunit TctC